MVCFKKILEDKMCASQFIKRKLKKKGQNKTKQKDKSKKYYRYPISMVPDAVIVIRASMYSDTVPH